MVFTPPGELTSFPFPRLLSETFCHFNFKPTPVIKFCSYRPYRDKLHTPSLGVTYNNLVGMVFVEEKPFAS